MRIFLSYRFTGEDLKELAVILENIVSSLKKAGHEVFCSFWKGKFFDKNKFTARQILEYALGELENCDAILAFVKSKKKSEGMLLEIGYALARKKLFILAIKEGINTTFLKQLADQIIEFKTLEELYKKLKKFRIE